MKVSLIKLGGIYTGKTHLSLQTVCIAEDINPNEIDTDHKAILMIDGKKISCTVARVSKTKSQNRSGAYDFTLCTSNANYDYFKEYVYKNDLSFELLLEEKVRTDDLAEANKLLDELARMERRSKADLLCELTKFKMFPGHRDLKLVSAKQMPILKDKIIKRLHPEDKESVRT